MQSSIIQDLKLNVEDQVKRYMTLNGLVTGDIIDFSVIKMIQEHKAPPIKPIHISIKSNLKQVLGFSIIAICAVASALVCFDVVHYDFLAPQMNSLAEHMQYERKTGLFYDHLLPMLMTTLILCLLYFIPLYAWLNSICKNLDSSLLSIHHDMQSDTDVIFTNNQISKRLNEINKQSFEILTKIDTYAKSNEFETTEIAELNQIKERLQNNINLYNNVGLMIIQYISK